MKSLDVPRTRCTPRVRLESESGRALFEGSSYPENASDFYQPVFDWFQDYLEAMSADNAKPLRLELELVYLNSSSSKILMTIFDLLEDAVARGADVRVLWRYHPENETAHECGEEFKEDFRHLPFSLEPVSRLLDV